MKYLGSNNDSNFDGHSQKIIMRFCSVEFLSMEKQLDYIINNLNDDQIREVTKGKENRKTLERLRDNMRHILIKYADKIDMTENQIHEWQYALDEMYAGENQ